MRSLEERETEVQNNKPTFKSVFKRFDRCEEETLKRVELLKTILINLRYEGKASIGRNAKEARLVLNFFKKNLIDHFRIEEKIFFPFLKIHLPKLDPVICLLHSEHQDFKRCLSHFQKSLSEVLKKKSSEKRRELIEKLMEHGTYMIYLLRNHFLVETKSVHQVVNRQLRLAERKELLKRLSKGHAHS